MQHSAEAHRPPEAKTSPGAAIDTIQRELSMLIRRALRGIALKSEGQEHNLDLAAYSLLIRLADEGPQRSGDLARAFGVDKSTMSRQVASLERAGLVGRVEDPVDGRAYQVSISPRGRRALESTRTERRQLYRDLLAHWPEADRREFARLLAKYNEDMAPMVTGRKPAPGRPG
jgi:DNA-binding MarR family transcriptional regulator